MSDRVALVFIMSDAIWQPASGTPPALRVFASLEGLQRAGVRLILLAPSESDARAVQALCESQGIQFAAVHTVAAAADAFARSHGQESSPGNCVLVSASDSLRAVAQQFGIPSRRYAGTESGSEWPELVRELTARRALIDRTTKETRISGRVDLDASSPIRVATGIGFFDHMLEQIAKHGGFALELKCEGDLHIDEHHTIEDCALALGDALRRALGDKLGIARYGFLLPMDEAEAQVALDLSGRAYAVFEGRFGREVVGGMPTELVPHFFRSLAESLGAALHVQVRGENAHHMVEACFKGVGRALRQACKRDGTDLPSTKGVL
jgi:imidazoleglycerol phosphate dehydratase HisB